MHDAEPSRLHMDELSGVVGRQGESRVKASRLSSATVPHSQTLQRPTALPWSSYPVGNHPMMMKAFACLYVVAMLLMVVGLSGLAFQAIS